MVPLRSLSCYTSTLIKETPEFAVDYLIIGGGVVGLAIAERLSRRKNRSTLLVERNAKLGMETSSRNSEVIHAGIYYPNDSLKTRLCLRGKDLLYSLCSSEHIPFRRIGKWIVSHEASQTEYLHSLQKKATFLGVETHFLSKNQREREEPDVKAFEALYSPTTGILDSHAYMSWLEMSIQENGGDIALRSEVTGIKKDDLGYLVNISSISLTKTTILAKNIVNAAGLRADKIANMILPSLYKIHYAKGHYYSYSDAEIKVNHLIYPVPPKNLENLGIHLTLDLAGRIRFGPDLLYVERPDDYDFVDEKSKKERFMESIRSYLPKIRKEALYVDYTGIRPKLQGPGETFKDYVIQEESDKGYEGFVNLIGIESPGLTSSLAIGEMIAEEILIDD